MDICLLIVLLCVIMIRLDRRSSPPSAQQVNTRVQELAAAICRTAHLLQTAPGYDKERAREHYNTALRCYISAIAHLKARRLPDARTQADAGLAALASPPCLPQRTYRVLCLDRSGHSTVIDEQLSREDAQRLQQQLEADSHQESFWVEVDPEPK